MKRDFISIVRRISWLDSANQPSLIHLTADGGDTICGGHAMYIRERRMVRSPKQRHGHSNHCRVCFKDGMKSAPWDVRCKE